MDLGSFLIVADDFTGANDTGVQLCKNGIETNVVFGADGIEKNQSYVIDTESRAIAPEDAYEKVYTELSKAVALEFKYYYKKIDSTIRGNIKSEVKAMADVMKPDLIVFQPANPDSNRIVVDGTLLFNNVPITKTEIAKDPLCHVNEDNMKKLMEGLMQEQVQHITLEELRTDKINWNKSRIMTFDAIDNSDMDKMVKFVLRMNKKILWVGSAGMANSLIRVLHSPKPVLSIVGSISDTSRNQVKEAVNKGACMITVDISAVLMGKDCQEYVNQAIYKLKNEYDTIICSAPEMEDYYKSVKTGSELGMSKEEVARFTQKVLGEITYEILSHVEISGLFLTGGDTAISVAKKNNSNGSKLISEMLPVIPLASLNGGDNRVDKVILKGGSIGDKDALAYCIEHLKK